MRFSAPQPTRPRLAPVHSVVQRVAVTRVDVQPIFTTNHIAADEADAIRKFTAQGRTQLTTYLRAPNFSSIQNTTDRTGRGRGLSDQVATYRAPVAYNVRPGATGPTATGYNNLDVVLKGNVGAATGPGRGFVFYVTGIHRTSGGTPIVRPAPSPPAPTSRTTVSSGTGTPARAPSVTPVVSTAPPPARSGSVTPTPSVTPARTAPPTTATASVPRTGGTGTGGGLASHLAALYATMGTAGSTGAGRATPSGTVAPPRPAPRTRHVP